MPLADINVDVDVSDVLHHLTRFAVLCEGMGHA